MTKSKYQQASEPPMRWHTDSTFDDHAGPRGSISLVSGSATHPLLTDRYVAFRSLSKEDHATWGVPKDADLAAMGWWAGYGEIVYAVRSRDEIKIYHRVIEEQVDAQRYALIKRIPINNHDHSNL